MTITADTCQFVYASMYFVVGVLWRLFDCYVTYVRGLYDVCYWINDIKVNVLRSVVVTYRQWWACAFEVEVVSLNCFYWVIYVTKGTLRLLLLGAFTNGIELQWVRCVLARPVSITAGFLGGLAQNFQLIVFSKEEIDLECLLESSTQPENVYPTLEEAAGTEDARICKNGGRRK